MDENSLTHYGVLGMKWGRRKQKVSKGSNTKKSSKSKQSSKKTSNIKNKIQSITSKVDKEKVKNVAKTTAKVAGGIASTMLLGTAGLYAFDQINRAMNPYAHSYSTVIGGTRDAIKEASGGYGRDNAFQKVADVGNPSVINKKLRLLPTTENGKSNGVIWAIATYAKDEARKNGGDPLDIANDWLIEYNNSNRKMSDIIGINKK